MVERLRGPVRISALRIGRTDLGEATALVDEEAVTLTVRAEGAERALRLRFASIDSIHRSGDELELVVRDGTRVTLAAPSAFADEVAGHCRTLPELTRTLRAFGSKRMRPGGPTSSRASGDSEQQRFFAPLIDARRNAVNAAGMDAITAFNGSSLLHALDQTLKQFAADRYAEMGPARRALEAELVDASEPLFDALRALRDAATAALDASNDLRLWRAWSVQLRMTFETADRVWIALDAALNANPVPPPVTANARRK